MEYLSRSERRKRSILLFVGYGLVSIAVALSTIILVYEAKGYDIDPNTRTVIQNGLLFVNSLPDAATIYIDGKVERARTDARLVLPAGNYDVAVKRDGYRSWNKKVNVEGGAIEFDTYIKLFPDVLTAEPIKSYTAPPVLIAGSPDHRTAIVVDNFATPTVTRYDLTSTRTAFNTFSPDFLNNPSDPITRLQLVQWSLDSKAALLKRTLTSGVEQYVWFDVDNPNSSMVLVNEALPAINAILFKGSKNNEVYVRTTLDNAVHSYLPKSATLGATLFVQSGPLWSMADEAIVFVGSVSGRSDMAEFYLYSESDKRSYPVGLVAKDATARYYVDSNRFNGKLWLAVSSASDQFLQLYANPLENLRLNAKSLPTSPYRPIIKFRIGLVNSLAFSSDGHYLAGRSDSDQMAVYDLDLSRSYKFDLTNFIVNNKIVPKIDSWNWFDNDHLAFVQNNTLTVCDFDRTNCQELLPSSAGQFAVSGRRQESIYSLDQGIVSATWNFTRHSLLSPVSND